jgi:hypothetical protein
MLPTLLWRCPLCKTHDALTHEPRRLRPDLIRCTACQARWELKRVVGGPDFRLRLLGGKGPGEERPLAEWYDRMMAGLALAPIAHPVWPVAGISAPGEELYLHSPQVRVLADADNPIFRDAPLNPPNPSTSLRAGVGGKGGPRPLGAGQLLFTSHHLLCLLAPPPAAVMGAHPAVPGNMMAAAPPGVVQVPRPLSLPWAELTSADTLMDRAFVTIFGERLYAFMLNGQSPLKWLAYTRLMAERLDPAVRHRLHLGYV